jgi:foldase protein PrsA
MKEIIEEEDILKEDEISAPGEEENDEKEKEEEGEGEETATKASRKKEGKKKEIIIKKNVNIKINLKKAIIVAIILAIGILAFCLKGFFIAATINGQPISRLAVVRELESVSGKSALDSLITQKLVGDEAKKKGISVSDDEINAEMKKAEAQIKEQGKTLDEALAAQNMTLADLKKQIAFQKTLEKILGDKLNVTAEEITKYMADNQITPPSGQEVSYQEQIVNLLKQQKFNAEAQALIDSLRAAAKINYFWKY